MKTNRLKENQKLVFAFFMALLMIGSEASAQSAATGNQSIVYQGHIIRPDGKSLNSGTVNFTLSVYSPAPSSCLLYSETQSLDMTGSKGTFSLKLGEGTRSDGGAHSYMSIFVNGSTLSGLTCASGNSYTAASSDERKLRVTLNDAGTVVNLTAMSIKSVPFALQAQQIDGWGLNNIVKVSSVGSPTTFTTAELAKVKGISALGCAANEILKWNGSAWACSADATGATTAEAGYGAAAKGLVAFDTDAATSGITVASGIAKLSLTGVSAGTYGAAGSVSQLTVDSQGRITSASAVPIQISSNQISVSGGTLGQVLKWNGSAWLPSADLGITSESDPTVQSFAKNAPSSRFVTTGSLLDLAASGVSAGTYGSSTQIPVVTVDAYGRVTSISSTAAAGGGFSVVGSPLNAAQFWVGSASNVAAAVSLSGDASLFNDGSLTINKLQGQTLTLAANPGAGSMLTYNTTLSRWEAAALPDCTASETLGFNAVSGNYECQAINNATNFTGSLAGDVTGSQGSTTVSRLQGQALQASSPSVRDTLVYNGSAWVNANIPSCGANQYLSFNGTYFCGTDSGAAGSVSSVDVAVPSFMSRTGGPVTSSGTISLGLQNQNANLVFAGPASGGAAAPSFRSLASDDIPALDAAKISTGTVPVSRGGTGSGAALSNNKVMVSSGGAIVEGDGFGSAKANNTYVVRDASGNFAAGAVTVDSSILKGSTSGSLTLQVPATVTSYALTFPAAVGSAGQVLATDASGNLSWATPSAGGGGLPANSMPIYQVRVATTANITLSGTQTIDGVTVVAGDRVLVKNQSSAASNGVYVVAAGAWTRATDMDTWSEVVGYTAQVSEGAKWAGMTFTSAAAVGGTLGTSSFYWSAAGSGNTSQFLTALGYGALLSNTTGNYNTAYGSATLSSNTTGYNNTAHGAQALYSNTVGYNNTANGSVALFSNTDGDDNTASGAQGLYSNTTGNQNTASGALALYTNSTGSQNTASGSQALYSNTTGLRNTADGFGALYSNRAKIESTAIGYRSMYYADNSTTSVTTFNTALGAYSLQGSATAAANTGLRNTALGHSALYSMTSGSGNVGIGTSAGYAITTGSNNIVIGSNTGSGIATSSNNILIADGAGNERLRVNSSGFVGIGTTAPRATLDVNGPIVGKASVDNAGATIDFASGNIQHSNSNCGSFALHNLKDGGSYMFIVKGTSVATCSFAAYSDSGSTALTVHLPPDHGATTSGKHTVYNIAVSGGDAYFAWIAGY